MTLPALTLPAATVPLAILPLVTVPSSSLRGGLEPTPAEARDWLERELQGPDYQSSWLDQAIRWILDQLGNLLDGANGVANSGVSMLVTVLVAAAVIALLVWVLPKVRRESGVASLDGAVLEDPAISASAYRNLAAQAFGDGHFDDAVLNWFRAIAKDMSIRTLLDDAPGRTAHEVSLALAPRFPEHAGRLARSADLFDAVRYGHRSAAADQADQVRQLDADLVRSRPALPTSPLQDLTV